MQFFTSLGLTDGLADLAQAAETAGYEGTTLADHVFFPEQMQSRYPYSPDGSVYWDGTVPWPDPWVSIGAMAMVTTRLRFITSVYILPLRNPFTTAKAVGTAAVVSGGRVILGGGIGWMRDEFDQLGVDFHTRGARTSEIIEVLRLLWSGEMVEYHGKHYDFGRVQMSPAAPAQVPIYMGGESEPALRRAAKLADGFISVPHDPMELAGLIGRLNALRDECGRRDEPFAFFTINPEPGPVDDYRRLADLGVTGVIEGPPVGPDASASEHVAALHRFGTDVIARLAEDD
jgi:probable F420-dependent oxidoreductase